MNIKTKLSTLVIFAALAAAAQETQPAATEETPTSPTALTSPATPSTTDKASAPAPAPVADPATTDEIDLEEIDDSALAAARPQIRSADKTGPVTLVDIDCDDATLADILRQFRKTTGANIISTDSTNLLRRVSASLRRVPWLQALTELLNSRGFRLDERDNVYRVVEDRQVIPVVTKTFQLNHASAKELADLFNKSYAQKDKNGKIQNPIATYFEGANVVVVTAPEKIISDCVAIVKAVDHAIPQIYIEARFLELSSQALHKLGMNWSSLSSWGVTAKNVKFGAEKNYGRAANYGTKSVYTPKNMVKTGTSSSLTESTSETSSSTKSSTSPTSSRNTSATKNTTTTDNYTDLANGASAIQNNILSPTAIGEAAGAGLSSASMGWASAGGFSGQLSADDFSLALSAFEEFGEGKIFSNPKVIVSNGKKAFVDMTTKFPNVELTSQRGNESTYAYTDFSAKIQEIPGDKEKGLFAGSAFYHWGIELSVTPRISPDGLISVEITPSISQLDTDVSDSGFYTIQGGASDSAYSSYPIISYKSITTDFTMKDGSTAVIGGLSRTVEDDVDSGIPYLRKIPWIGPKLFGWKSRQKVQKEILVCVTIGIANPESIPKDIGLPKNAIMGREYVEGRRLEPGDRAGTASKVLTIDMRSLDEQNESAQEKKPSVEIRPSAPAKEKSQSVLSDIETPQDGR